MTVKPKNTLNGSIKKGPISYELALFTPVVLRETANNAMADNAEGVVKYWREQIETSPNFDAMKENMVVFFLNARRRIIGHHLACVGTIDQVICTPREVFRLAIVTGAQAVIIAHNHPSGDSTPSDADIRVTRSILRGGQTVCIELLDHIILGTTTNGSRGYTSLRELGHFHS
jgi:DNA repair protein RadC